MQDEPKNDVNLNVMGTGCGASCGTGCAAVVVVTALTIAIGVQAARQSPALPLLGFLIGLLSHLAIGYFTARAARAHKVAVNFHVMVFGAFVMLLGLLSWVLPDRSNVLSKEVQSLAQLLRVVSWVLTIPAMLLGASWSAEEPD